MSTEHWQDDWRPLQGLIGQHVFTLPEHQHWGTPREVVRWAPERVEQTAIRRFLEPLEFAAPLHEEPVTARRQGYADIPSPVSALSVFALPPVWQPGQGAAFVDNDRDALPSSGSFASQASFPHAPAKYCRAFGTDFEVDIERDAVCGTLLGRRGSLLLEVIPKSSQIGRGCFVKWQSELVDERLVLIAVTRLQIYVYEPHA